MQHSDHGGPVGDSSATARRVAEVVGQNVRAERARLRLRQEDLAERTGLARPVVAVIENGGRRVTIADAVLLCRALEVSLRALLDGLDVEDLAALGL